MNNFIIIRRTYTELIPGSEKAGIYRTNVINDRQEVTFRELVELMKAHPCPCACGTPGITWWFTNNFYTTDSIGVIERQESIHYHLDNSPNAAKYWLLARKFADKPRR